MRPGQAHTLRRALSQSTALIVATTVLVMVVSVVWNQHQADERFAVAQAQVSLVAHQRDQALQEVRLLITSSAASSARDAENISLLLNYLSRLNRRDALLFRYLHRLNVPIPADLLQPIPAPKLIPAPATKRATRPKGHHSTTKR